MRDLAAHLFVIATVVFAALLADLNDCIKYGAFLHTYLTELSGDSGQLYIMLTARNLFAFKRRGSFALRAKTFDQAFRKRRNSPFHRQGVNKPARMHRKSTKNITAFGLDFTDVLAVQIHSALLGNANKINMRPTAGADLK